MSGWTGSDPKNGQRNFDEVAELLGLPTSEEFQDSSMDHDSGTYSYVHREAYQEALDDGLTEEEAEELATEKAQKAEEEEQDEAWRMHYDAVTYAAEKILDHFGLALVPATSAPQAPRRGARIKPTLDGAGMEDARGDFRDLARKARAQGWVVELTAGNHFVWIPPDKTKPKIYSSSTPSDWRAIRKHLSLLRRAGFKD